MRLRVLGSGSSGNCYILENDNEALIIEAGLPFMEVKKTLNFNVMKIKAVITTHIHSDHHQYFFQYVRAGIPVWEPFKLIDGNILQFGKESFSIRAFENRDNGNYEPSNCRWVTRKEQTRNRSITKTIPLARIAEIDGITYQEAYKKYVLCK